MDLSGWSEHEVRAFLQSSDRDEITRAVRDIGVARVLDTVFPGLAAAFGPDRRRRPGRLSFQLAEGPDHHLRATDLDKTGGRVAPAGDATATIAVSVVHFLQLGVGAVDAPRLVLTRRLSLSGDRLWAVSVLRGLRTGAT